MSGRVSAGDRLMRTLMDHIDRRILELLPFVTDDWKLNLNSRDIVGQLPGKSGGTSTTDGVTIRGARDYDDGVAPTSGQVITWDGSKYHPATPAVGLADPTTTKGDLIARGASAPPTRLPVGADGDVLIADATQATGLRWGAPAAATTLAALTDVALADLRDGDTLVWLASDSKWHNRHAPSTITLGGAPVTLDGSDLTLGV
ncbi:MAG TPA: hypothetical protein VFL91_08545 [Thermomicrobiales bacterium]|nr:hypothetical protein [Thermomicrobiales bacterium]